MCKSDWNFDYHRIIFLKEILWTKSTGLWTDERAPIHGSTVDRSGYPFRVLIWSVHFGFDGWEGGPGNGGCGQHGNGLTKDRSEWCFGALKLVVRSQGGVGEDGEVGGDVGEALEGRR
jgi:hypothetical protein